MNLEERLIFHLLFKLLNIFDTIFIIIFKISKISTKIYLYIQKEYLHNKIKKIEKVET